MSFFSKLETRNNYRIGFCYQSRCAGSSPCFFAMHQDSVVYRDSNSRKRNKNTFIPPDDRASDNLIPEDSKIGFLHYLFFSEMGEQFALYWHARYNEKYVICCKEDLADIQSRQGFYVDYMMIRDLRNIELYPIIEKSTDCYLISWIEIRTHNGIYKCTYEIERSSPYEINMIYEKQLVEIETYFFY